MFTKHTFHSTVNPLDAKQTHRAAPPLGTMGPRGGRGDSSILRPSWMFLISLLFYTHNPTTSICCTARVPDGSLLPGGYICFLSSSQWENNGQRCRESAQLCLEGVWALVPEAVCPFPALLGCT